MALTPQDVEALLQVLAAEPRLRLELAGMMATDLLREVKEVLAETASIGRRTDEQLAALAAAHARAEERLTRLEATVERLAEAQAAAEERLTRVEGAVARLEAAVERLAEAQARTEERLTRLEETVQRLAEAQVRTERQVQRMAANLEVLNRRSGRWLEAEYREKAGAYFGEILRRVRTESPVFLEDVLESHLATADFADVLQIDALVKGTLRDAAEAPEVCWQWRCRRWSMPRTWRGRCAARGTFAAPDCAPYRW